MIEEAAVMMKALDPAFPVDEVRAIAKWLGEADALVPGFIPSAAGLTAFNALVPAAYGERVPTWILSYRNIVSRMARRTGWCRPPPDAVTQTAIEVMALAQAMNFEIEPAHGVQGFGPLGERRCSPIRAMMPTRSVGS